MKLEKILLNRYTIAFGTGATLSGIGQITNTHWIPLIPFAILTGGMRNTMPPAESIGYNMLSKEEKKEIEIRSVKDIATIGCYMAGASTFYIKDIYHQVVKYAEPFQELINQVQQLF